MRENVIDLAVTVVIGVAFGKIVSSLVENIITPLIGLLLDGVNFNEYSIVVGDVVMQYGIFIQSIIDFIIIAFAIFVAVRIVNKLQEKGEEKKKAEPAKEIRLLTEIRDSLRK